METSVEKNVNSGDISYETILSQASGHPEFPGYYIHRTGLILSKRSRKILKPSRCGSGSKKYLFVVLRKEGKSIAQYVHRLVAQVFIGNPQGKPQVNHLSGDTFDNGEENLEWVTPKENSQHSVGTGLHLTGARCPWAALSETLVHAVCGLLEQGIDSKSIREATGIDSKALCKIKRRDNWRSISSAYVF